MSDTSVAEEVASVIHARWVVPVVPEGVYLDHHSVAVSHDGTIVAIVPTSDAATRFVAKKTYDLSDGYVIFPGLINMHNHTAMVLLRGLADGLSLHDWLANHIWPVEAQFVSAEFCRDGSTLACAEMIRTGTTLFNDMYYFPEETARVVDRVGLRAVIGAPLIKFPTKWSSGLDESLRKLRAMAAQYATHDRVHVAVAPHAPYTTSDEDLAAAELVRQELDLPIHMHLHETKSECDDALSEVTAKNERPLARLKRLGLLHSRLLAVHMTQLTDEELAWVRESGVHVVHCPSSNMKLASGTCPVPRLLDEGVNVCLGTDGASSNDALDMLAEARTASLLHKLQSGDAATLPAARSLSMATINGARALGLDDRLGSLEPGKLADIVACKLISEPVFNPITTLAYVSTNHVSHVWVGGRALLENYELQTLSHDEILSCSRKWASSMRAWIEQSKKNANE